jgi:hypothetical protein
LRADEERTLVGPALGRSTTGIAVFEASPGRAAARRLS